MTPLSAQLFRFGDEEAQHLLARCQFFECSKITDMAQEMGKADVDAGGSDFSLGAQLPAPRSAFEGRSKYGRWLIVAEQDDQEITYLYWVVPPGQKVPQARFSSGFKLGTAENLAIHWARWPGEPSSASLRPEERATAQGFNLLLEKILCIINQPGLVQRVERETDKRVVKAARALPDKPDVSKFFECRIRPGQHGEAAGESGIEMPLHYVRKHLRPSSGKWVDGYWRGNADLGLHLKWYTPPVPGKASA